MADEQKVITNFAEQISSDTDDDVSVIAVIGKRSVIPGVPKHAKYYASKLPTRIGGGAAADLKFSKEKIKTIVADESAREMMKNNDSANTRVIELSDRNSKMELRKQFKVETASPDNSEKSILRQGTSANYESLEILQKLPPGTVLIKQNAKGYREDSDYVHESSKDSTETNSSGSSSTASVITEKVKRLHRTARSKKIVEVRRNPMRMSKRDVDKDFPRPRQRLLTAKRKESFSELVPTKRTKVSTMPYMNTRSVTRKLYTVGATYQAPTVRDETEWKEWPVHGMHERPVYHPQFGLAVEYVGRFFTSLDGCTYREILYQPEIEVVSVDPHAERVFLLNKEKKSRNKRTKDQNDQENVPTSKDNSFEVCMHNSLHNVFAYCAQVLSPAYEKDVEQKIAMIRQNPTQSSLTTLKNDVVTLTESKEVVESPEVHYKKKLNQINIAKDSATSFMVPRDSSVNLLQVKSAETNCEDRQESYKRSIKNTFTFVKATDTIPNYGNVSKVTSSELNLTKLEDSAISDEALMEMSSIYKKLVPTEDLISSCENSPTERNFCKRSTVKYDLPKMVNKSTSSRKLDFSGASKVCRENAKMTMVKEANSSDILSYYTINDVKNVDKNSSTNSKISNETSEIARILSEYNQSVKRPNVQSTYYSPSKRSTVETLWTALKRIEVENCQRDEKNEAKSKSKVDQILTSELVEYNKSRQDKWKALTSLRKERILETIEEFSKNPCGSTSLDIVGRSKVSVPVLKVRVDHNVNEDTGKSGEGKGTAYGNDKSMKKTQLLQELLENTAVLYCAATGVHQDDLVGYMDSLDTKQSVQWMEAQSNSVI